MWKVSWLLFYRLAVVHISVEKFTINCYLWGVRCDSGEMPKPVAALTHCVNNYVSLCEKYHRNSSKIDRCSVLQGLLFSQFHTFSNVLRHQTRTDGE